MVTKLVAFLIGSVTGAVFIGAITLSLVLLHAVRVSTTHGTPVTFFTKLTHPVILLPVVAVEELFSRSLLIGWLGHFIGLPAAFVVSALVFALLHVPNGKVTVISVLNLVVVSLFFGLLYIRLGIWAAIGIHYTWNLSQWTILGYPMYGQQVGRRMKITAIAPEWISGGDFGPEYSLITSIGLLVATVGILLI